MVPNEHADTVSLVETPTTTSTPAGPQGAQRAVDNGAQAERAERERTFTTGGDADPAPPAPPVAIPPPSRLALATASVRRTERPSPFGVAQFPPLPVPPGISSRS